jgi:hypothetical protein
MSPFRPLLPATAAASPLARHRAFLGLRAAGARAALRPPPLERVLRRPPRPLVAHTSLVLQAFHLWQSQRHLHWRSVSQRLVAPARQLVLVREQAARAGGGTPQARQAVPRAAATLLVSGAAQGTQGHPAPVPGRPAAPALPLVVRRAEARAAYPRVGTTLARPSAARADAAPARAPRTEALAPVDARDPTRAPRAALAQAQQDWTLPPRELARITASVSDQVIGQLERRALSLRERSGRI